MPDASNTNTGRQVTSTLNAIPFDNLLGGPLAACVHAQAEAAQTTVDYIRHFAMTASAIDPTGSEPVTVSFTFVMNGMRHLMTVPLMTLVPIPYMRIDHVDLSFTADITACDDSKMEARYALEPFQCSSDSKQSVSMQSKMGITIHAATTDMPAGMAKMLDFFNNNLIVQQTLTASDVNNVKQEMAKEQADRQADELKRRRLLAALVQAIGRKAQRKEDTVKNNEELKQKEEYLKNKEEAQRTKENELKKKEEELKNNEKLQKQKEAEQKEKENELKKKEEELKNNEKLQKQKEAEQKAKENELKKKNDDQKNNEKLLNQKETEQKAKENELKKKEEELKKLQVLANKGKLISTSNRVRPIRGPRIKDKSTDSDKE